MDSELQDWELLQSSDSDLDRVSPERNLEGIEGDTEGMIRSDYFSLDNQSRYAKTVAVEGDVSEEGSVESDNPSWIDPGSETRYERKNLGGFWSDSGSDRSDDRKLSDYEVKNELGLVGNEKGQLGFEGIGEMEAKSENLGKIEFGISKSSDFDMKSELGFVEKVTGASDDNQVNDKVLDNCWSDSGGDGLVSMKFRDAEKESEIDLGDLAKRTAELESSGEFDGGNDSTIGTEGAVGNSDVVDIKEMESSRVNSVGKEEKRRIAWWKVPFEVLKYCLFKVSPVWSISVVATVMGFVILGRRLYRMKRKRQSLQLKVTVDDKKVSQFMNRAARLNDAFSVVRRVPIVRPALPAGGVNPWPVMGMMR
ncbi:hypothetical protein SLE2022_327100 [Rubroshorea leprosula]|uniref:DUF6821 domain-containing protein n=1 Tax=Rubroshorea leprosula TaxID=152421 RepID=A0AAV5J9T7_9ROSI|nr:hypothetical protein SLEP1_g20763 [Rubroshorea leprosula]